MSAIEQAIKEAVEKGGWNNHPFGEGGRLKLVTSKIAWWAIGGKDDQGQWLTEIFLDPSFWQSLGNARSWKTVYGHCGKDPEKYEDTVQPCCFFGGRDCEWFVEGWRYHFNRFIDHLAEGKDAESFFAAL